MPMESNPAAPAAAFDLKKTVCLPHTAFPMKANLPQNEPKILERWQQMDLYAKLREVCEGRPRYVLHDGPPYANGNIHLGHALNKLLKDFVVKSKSMAGFDSPYVPGWDCHGLPIEKKVDEMLGGKKAKMSTAEIRALCREYAGKYIDLQRQDFKRLGIFGRWDDPYLTMSAEYEAIIAQAFVDFVDRGYVYKGLKPVNWCIQDRTALAEAEVEYENHASPSIWVRFRLTSDPAALDPALAGRDVYGVIWTTTPWTIPANLGICYQPHFDYSAVEYNGGVYLIATALVKATAEKAGWGEVATVAEFKGAKLERAVFRHPFLERDSLGILADHVTLEQGTGAVHTAPGHGHEDYLVGLQYGLPVYCPVDAAGRLYQAGGAPGELPEVLLGKTVWEANPVVMELLEQHGALLAQAKVDHSYPHCWRCHKPTIFRATEQWFIGMERNNLRQNALDAIKRVTWYPEWGEERISNMIAARPDWCISRQRVWGVPIIAFTCEDCGYQLTDKAHLDRVVKVFREETADAWYSRSVEELLGENPACAKCGAHHWRKETDILDVWFDSGTSHLAVLNDRYGLKWPSQMYLEGGDQYRGWFHSSLLVGVGLCGTAPYSEVVTNGWTLDEEGRAMSKSLGNGIEPEKVIKQSGAEVLRLWVASINYQEDVRLGPTMLKRLEEAYRKLRNTIRYALGALDDFDPARDAVPGAEMLEIDQWILRRTAELVEKCTAWYGEYAFFKVYRAIYDFATIDLSAVYFDIIKDRLYTWRQNGRERRSAQTAVYRLNDALVRLLAPILAFTAEEAWALMAKPAEAPASVHLALFPQAAELTGDVPAWPAEREEAWAKLLTARDEVLKALEESRQAKVIGSSLEARVTLEAGPELLPVLEQYRADLEMIFIVSGVHVTGRGAAGVGVKVDRAEGTKCERCWRYTQDVGSHPGWPTVCARCAEAVVAWVARHPEAAA
jgi:isoleucyl-tRNA synthetase